MKRLIYFLMAFVFLAGVGLAYGAENRITNSIGMELVLIPAGSFIMGSPTDEPGRFDNEIQHRVTISRPYYLQTTEATQGQWKTIMGNNPSVLENCGDECPVDFVSWDNAQEFIRKLNQKENTSKYRLPTEAEWEYAARAGTTTAVYNGPITILGLSNVPALDPIAWYSGNSSVDYEGAYNCSDWKEKQYSISRCGAHPVARKQPNAWGLYDMLGNMGEWCQDWYGEYPSSSVTDPTGPESGMSRVSRGGCWYDIARSVRAANRFSNTPDRRSWCSGFRVARDF
jgi:formylglycine-generating enzyme required for sulfatase activity